MGVFGAGACTIGRHLIPMLMKAGHQVVGTTRSQQLTIWMGEMGATPAIVDIFEPVQLRDAVVATEPDVVMYQLTDLAAGFWPDDLLGRHASTPSGPVTSFDAALAADRLIGQSGAWHYP